MLTQKPASIAVIGAGVAGAVCARALQQAGHRVQVFDKARGPGGRLATRRLEWTREDGSIGRARLDHGALGFTASSEAFTAFLRQMEGQGLVTPWQPALAPDSLPLDAQGPLWVVTPDMPALCRHLLAGMDTQWSMQIDRLIRDERGWQLQAGGQRVGEPFDAVVLAIPPAQAAPLLSGLRDDWARYASLIPMQPCWTLMGVARIDAQDAAREAQWSLARPDTGPLAWVIRNDRRPGRDVDPGHAHWVVHARPGWSRLNLEQEADWVKHQLSTALEVALGHRVRWQHAVVHRWRYALPPLSRTPSHPQPPAPHHWWDEPSGLGVCGDLFTGHGMEGVEGAFLSAQALAAAMGAATSAAMGAAMDVAPPVRVAQPSAAV